MTLTSTLVRIFKIILRERRLPGRCYQLYFGLLHRLGKRFATVKSKNGFTVRGYTHCFSMFYETWSKHDYDIPGFRLTENTTVIDIGANQGFFSLYAASKGATVYAFEPCSENFEVLKWNVATNSLEDRVMLFNTAVAGTTGRVPLFVGLDASGGILSGSVSMCNADRGGKAVKMYPVVSTTLDSLFHEHHIEKCDFLKIDCEGAEYEILRATSPSVFRRIARISMECHDNRMSEAVGILKRAGFTIVSQTPGWTGILKATNSQVSCLIES